MSLAEVDSSAKLLIMPKYTDNANGDMSLIVENVRHF